MTKKVRKLKLPDGGHFDLAIPEGFGEPVLNEATFSKTAWIFAAGIFATLTVIAIVKAGSK